MSDIGQCGYERLMESMTGQFLQASLRWFNNGFR